MRHPASRLQDRVELKRLLGPVGKDLSDLALLRVLNKATGDVDLACTALTMVPRPPWVIAIAGPLEPAPAKERKDHT